MTEDKRDGLLSSKRVSATFDAHALASTEGGTTVRILALAGGLGLLVCSIMVWVRLGIIEHDFHFLHLVVSLTALVVGGLAFVLESHLSKVQKYREKITSRAPILNQVVGRGSMYATAGLVQCCILHPLNLVVGFFNMAVGIYLLHVGHNAAASLEALKKAINDEGALEQKFRIHDANGDGVLEAYEFDGLMLSLGMELDNDELDAVFSAIDSNGDQKIVYDEFLSWWKACTAEAEGTLV